MGGREVLQSRSLHLPYIIGLEPGIHYRRDRSRDHFKLEEEMTKCLNKLFDQALNIANVVKIQTDFQVNKLNYINGKPF
jgi:hypothetical protein